MKNGYKVMHLNWASNTWQDTDIVDAAMKQREEEEGGEDEMKEEGVSMS
jgi:hypothetical protein